MEQPRAHGSLLRRPRRGVRRWLPVRGALGVGRARLGAGAALQGGSVRSPRRQQGQAGRPIPRARAPLRNVREPPGGRTRASPRPGRPAAGRGVQLRRRGREGIRRNDFGRGGRPAHRQPGLLLERRRRLDVRLAQRVALVRPHGDRRGARLGTRREQLPLRADGRPAAGRRGETLPGPRLGGGGRVATPRSLAVAGRDARRGPLVPRPGRRRPACVVRDVPRRPAVAQVERHGAHRAHLPVRRRVAGGARRRRPDGVGELVRSHGRAPRGPLRPVELPEPGDDRRGRPQRGGAVRAPVRRVVELALPGLRRR
mmetsp:Transcript_10146/g.23759  ORF Transcript_10146/g.23759 Transcript_10146/m.23759 type:complete len:313 (+) Transcript_10146:342-1280(+)